MTIASVTCVMILFVILLFDELMRIPFVIAVLFRVMIKPSMLQLHHGEVCTRFMNMDLSNIVARVKKVRD